MNNDFAAAMSRALEQTRAGDTAQATRTIQAALAGRSAKSQASSSAARPQQTQADRIAPPGEDRQPRIHAPAPDAPQAPAASGATRRRPLREVVDLLRRGQGGRMRPDAGPMRTGRATARPDARWEKRSFSCAAGSRDYILHVPETARSEPRGLVLMLHGCTQDAGDFALGTDMNRVADRHGLVVAYPEQTRAHNAQACWNWFRPGDQGPGRGEPEILAGLARALSAQFGIPQDCVFAAGLSAGGAMAAILGVTHPDVFSAVGVHSGLPHGAAQDVLSAFGAMRGEAPSGPARKGRPVRTIVFHGSADATVHPSNADRVVLGARAGSRVTLSGETGRSPGGRAWSRAIARTPDGTVLTEDWRIQGAGHAWSGGAAAGSHTDPAGPDASEEMARFFMARGGAEA